ncbi:MAG: ABC transporter permease [Candidatus Brennerbacteria bacterium]|nr:ABC transporter permease [Candidatus Brennerbacteria bacterium]
MVTLSRIIKYGWQAFLRNGWLSLSTVSIMILAALVFEGLILFNVMGKTALESIQNKIDISVYFKSNAEEDAILNIKRSLEGLEEVKSVEYVSREQALAEFKARHEGEDTITQTLAELDENPLLASLNVKAEDPSEYAAIASYLENENLGDLVEKVTYAQNQVVIDRLVGLVDTMKKSGITLTVFLAFLAVTVTFNTIRLAIFSNREQISIMRLVGASNIFIRGPYTVEGIIYGAIAGIIGFLILIPVIGFLSPYVGRFIPELALSAYFRTHFFTLLLYQLLFCIALGIVSSIIATRRYLRL